jgi:hypothetical protein
MSNMMAVSFNDKSGRDSKAQLNNLIISSDGAKVHMASGRTGLRSNKVIVNFKLRKSVIHPYLVFGVENLESWIEKISILA